jgi:biofilm PGA synthesis lipoprotein PgaB
MSWITSKMMRRFALNPFVVSLLLAGAAAPCAAAEKPMRAVQADLDYVYDEDAAQTERNLDQFVERIAAIQPGAVFLQAFADPKGTGLASSTYFPNRHLPMRAELFGRVVSELKERTHVKVFGWLPVLSFDLGDKVTLVHSWSPATGAVEIDPKAYRRVSPFDTAARTEIAEIYEDMAKAAPIDGVLFHDDAMLSDFEDATPAALKAYKAAGLPGSIEAIRADPATLKTWSAFKTDALITYTKTLAAHVRQIRPALLTARNLYAPLMLDPQSSAWFAQDYDKFLTAYDYTAVEAMPRMEKIADNDSHDWLSKLVAIGAERPHGMAHTIFELQTVDWNLAAEGKDRAISDDTLGAEMRLLTKQGAVNFAYYPDDFVTDTPKLELLRKDFSLPTDL